jgi:hypothetical protein
MGTRRRISSTSMSVQGKESRSEPEQKAGNRQQVAADRHA